ncbi:MAG: matrixin family metalloprotease [Bdellovibrionaceae bacterium]|nr:matrixin family metalloprotease [Pseudobdellovibrionaceae bacterium]
MRKWIVLPFILIGLVALQACAPKAQDDCGFVQNVYGERISWKGQIPIVLHLHGSVPDIYRDAIQSAANTWNQRAGKTVFQVSYQKMNGQADGRDRMNVISFSPTWDQAKMSEQAKTTVHWVGDQIQEADIRVNNSNVFSYYAGAYAGTTGVNMEALILHEMGHVLGLKHNDKPTSVMQTYLANNSDRTELGPDDGHNLQCEY